MTKKTNRAHIRESYGSADEAVDSLGWRGALRDLVSGGAAEASMASYVWECLGRDTKGKSGKGGANGGTSSDPRDEIVRLYQSGALYQLPLPFPAAEAPQRSTQELLSALCEEQPDVWLDGKQWTMREALLDPALAHRAIAALDLKRKAMRQAFERANWVFLVAVDVVGRVHASSRAAE